MLWEGSKPKHTIFHEIQNDIKQTGFPKAGGRYESRENADCMRSRHRQSIDVVVRISKKAKQPTNQQKKFEVKDRTEVFKTENSLALVVASICITPRLGGGRRSRTG